MKKGENYFLNLLKATRIYRVFPTLLVILVGASIADSFRNELFLLGIISVLIYSAAGVHNAIRDKDYNLNKAYKYFIVFSLVLAIFISLSNLIIFLTTISWILLGIIYNTSSRFILLGDTTVMAVTHYALPLFSSLILLGLSLSESIKFAGFFFVLAWFWTPIKNIKDEKKDLDLGYKTLFLFKKGRKITALFFCISFLLMVFSYFVFSLNYSYFIFLFFVLISFIILVRNILKDNNDLRLVRISMMLFLLGIIVSSTSDAKIIVYALIVFLIYPLNIFLNFLLKLKNG